MTTPLDPTQPHEPAPADGYGATAPQPAGVPAHPGQAMMPELAGWPQRVLALIIDFGIVFVIYGVGFVLSGPIGDFMAILGWLAGFGFYLWQLVIQGQTGQTIGKKAIGIRLLSESTGQPIGAGLSIARYFVHIVDSLPCYLGFLWPLWDAKKQTFADKILGTLVVKA